MDFFRQFSIRTKLIIIMLAAGLPIVIAAFFDIYTRYQTERTEAEHAVLTTAQAIAFQHTAQIEGIRNLLITLSQFPEVRSKQGQACSAIIRTILRQSPSSLNIGIADLDGNIIASAVPATFVIKDRKYFQDAVRTRRFSVGEYVVGRATGRPTINFGMPVLDNAGNPVVVLYAAYDLTQFDAIFDAQDLPPNAVLNVSDHAGIILHHYPVHDAVKPGAKDRPDLRRHVTGADEEGTFFEVGMDGARRLLAFKRLRLHSDEPPYLYIRVSMPEQEALTNTNRFLVCSLFVFGLAGCLALVSTRILAGRYLVIPVEQMAAVSQAVAGGNLAVRSGLPYTYDEIGQLARSFDSMAASLDARLQERDRAEASLRQSEEKFRAIFDSLNDAILIHDLATGMILDVNQAMCRLFGYSHDQACGLTIDAISQGESPYGHQEALSWVALAAQGQPQLFEWRCRHRDGRLFWAEVSMRRAAVDGTDRLLVLLRDISERKEAEEERRSLTEQLTQAQRIESIGRLAGGIAHDFNNLLTPIIGYSELVQRGLAGENPAREKIGHILQAAGRAKDLTRQLLSFGRKQILDMRHLDLNRIIGDFADILRRTIGEHIRIDLLPAPDLEAIYGDKTQIEQVLMNLVVNARDAIGGSGTITIETAMVELGDEYVRNHAAAQPGRHVMLAVSDSGAGMDKETQEHIFEPFFTTKGVGEGSGLGLATVYGIVKQHRGSIWVYSEVGRGTVFKLYFPAYDHQAARDQVPESTAALPHQGKGTIMLVEDNALVRDMVGELLVSCGYTVIEAETPLKALELKEGVVLDLLITDVIMPDMAGPDLYRRMAERQPDLRVLYMSGYTDSVIIRQGELEQGAFFIQKPFSVAAMESKVAGIVATEPPCDLKTRGELS